MLTVSARGHTARRPSLGFEYHCSHRLGLAVEHVTVPSRWRADPELARLGSPRRDRRVWLMFIVHVGRSRGGQGCPQPECAREERAGRRTPGASRRVSATAVA